MTSGEKHSNLFNKISTMFKNVRYLYKMLGTTDISQVGNGTVTGAISVLNTNVNSLSSTLARRMDIAPGGTLSCSAVPWNTSVCLLVTRYSLFFLVRWSANIGINSIVNNGDVTFSGDISPSSSGHNFTIKNNLTATNYVAAFF